MKIQVGYTETNSASEQIEWTADGAPIPAADNFTTIDTTALGLEGKEVRAVVTLNGNVTGKKRRKGSNTISVPSTGPGGIVVTSQVAISYSATTGLVTITPANYDAADGVTYTVTYEAFVDSISMGDVTSPFAPSVLPSTVYVVQTIEADGYVTATSTSDELAASVMTSAPTFTASPVITGGPQVGATLSLSFTGQGNPNPTSAIVWKRNGTTISGQTGTTLATGSYTNGDTITAEVTLTNASGSLMQASNMITLVASTGFVGVTSIDGSKLILDLPAGFSDANSTTVDLSKITITQTTPSVSAAGVVNTASVVRLPISKAAVVSSKLELELCEYVSRYTTGITFVATAGAFVNGATSSLLISGNVEPRCIIDDAPITARLHGIVAGRSTCYMPLDIVSGTVYAEATAFHDSGIGCIKVVVSDGSTSQTHYATAYTPSRYQDTAGVSDAQWTKNVTASGNSALGGLGVISFGPIDMAAFAEGAVTFTLTAYAKAGGESNQVSEAWTLYNDKGGYVDRIRYVDSASGSDSADGLTPGTAFQTLPKAYVSAGGSGAPARCRPIIYLIGSGDVNSPREYVNVAGTANAQATDTYVTLMPAPGSAGSVRIKAASGQTHRVRRLKLKDLIVSLKNGTNTMPLMNNYVQTYTSANPATVMFQGCDVQHPDFDIGGNPSHSYTAWLNASGYNEANDSRLIILDCYANRMMAPLFTAGCKAIVRNLQGYQCNSDLIKNPNGSFFAIYHSVSSVPRDLLTWAIKKSDKKPDIVGTPIIGEVVDGLYSGATAIVERIPDSGSVFVNSRVGSFKPDDQKSHLAVTVADGSGYQVGENIGGTRTILRKDGNILRVADTNWSPTIGGNVVGSVTGTTSAVVSAVVRGTIIFGTSGAVAKYGPQHPDGVQVQKALSSQMVLSSVTGTFQVGDKLRQTVNGTTKTYQTVTAVGTAPDGRVLLALSSSVTMVPYANENKNTTGSVSGAVGRFDSYWRMSTNNMNLVMANVMLDQIEGAMIFIENGWNGATIANWLGTKTSISNDSQVERASGINLLHVQNHQIAHLDRHNTDANLRMRNRQLGCMWSKFTKQTAGLNIQHGHNADPDAPTTPFISSGDPLFVDGYAFNQVYDEEAFDLTPQPGSPLRTLTEKAFGQWYPFDIWGNPRPTNGTAAIGAMEAMPL